MYPYLYLIWWNAHRYENNSKCQVISLSSFWAIIKEDLLSISNSALYLVLNKAACTIGLAWALEPYS